MREEFDTDLEVEGAEETYTAYFNTDHEWVGNEYANAYGSGSYFELMLQTIQVLLHISLRAAKSSTQVVN